MIQAQTNDAASPDGPGETVIVYAADDGEARVDVRLERRSLKHYNLDAIVSVGYRVNSKGDRAVWQSAGRWTRGHPRQH